jgi:hypothetical protein
MNASISRFTPVLLAGLAVLATGCSAGSSSTSSTSTTAPRASASNGPTTATSTAATSTAQASPVVASSAPGGTDGAPACTAAQLTLRQLGGGLVSGGMDVYSIYFANTSSTACTLHGYPAVSAVTGPDGSAGQVGAAAAQSAARPDASLLLLPGHSAQATLWFAKAGVFASPQCHHVNVLYLKIVPPGGTTAFYAGIDEQSCAEATLATMTVTTLFPVQ